MLLFDETGGKECYAAAGDRDQAALLFNTAKAMLLNNEPMCDDLKPYMRELQRLDGDGFFKTISREANTKHGFNASFVAIDELHAQKTADLVEVLTTSTASREEPLVIYITTADFLRESICNDKYDYACKVRDGGITDPAFLPAIFEASVEDDWTSEETWKKANPNYGVSVFPEYLRREAIKAKQDSTYRNTFLRLHLNIRTNTSMAWIDLNEWDRLGGASLEYNGEPAVAGLDLGVSRDMTALSVMWPLEDGGYAVKMFYWIPADKLYEREKRDKVPISAWVRDGWIRTTPGDVTDFRQVCRDVAEVCQQFGVTELVYDKYLAMQMALDLQDQHGIECVEFAQTAANFNEPCRELDRLITGGQIMHGKNPVLRQNCACCMLRDDGNGRVRPDKKNSTGRIDGLVAMLMALGRIIVTDGASVYERDGIFTL